MHNRFSRAASVLGDDAMDRLAASRVAVFGIGGVGGFVVEALARCGVGTLDLIDSDKVTETNINRQITAACSTVGEYKTDVAERRIADISPETRVNNHKIFFLPETADSFDFSQYNYVVDATDTVRAKLEIIERCNGFYILACAAADLQPLPLSAAAMARFKDCSVTSRSFRRSALTAPTG